MKDKNPNMKMNLGKFLGTMLRAGWRRGVWQFVERVVFEFGEKHCLKFFWHTVGYSAKSLKPYIWRVPK